MATGGFGICFIGKSFPIADHSFVRVDSSHWVSVPRKWRLYTQAARFSAFCSLTRCLTCPMSLPITKSFKKYPSFWLSLVRWTPALHWACTFPLAEQSGSIAAVSNSQPSEVMPLQWPEQDQPLTVGPGTIQLGVSLEPQGKLIRCPCCSITIPHAAYHICNIMNNAFHEAVSCSAVHLTPCS